MNAGKVRYDSASADIDKDAWGAQRLIADADGIRRQKGGVAVDDHAPFHAAQPALDAVA